MPTKSLTDTARSRSTGSRRARPRKSKAEPIEGEPPEEILRAAGEVIDEAGYEGLNTSVIARRAGISTATLYRHFPDKHAVLRALVHHLQAERVEAMGRLYDALAEADDWRGIAKDAMLEAFRLRLARPGGRSTRRAMQSSPELWSWDRAQNEDLSSRLAKAILRRKPTLSPAVARRVALVTVVSSVALLDHACLEPRRGKSLIEEGAIMREAYLARYLD